MRHVGRARLLVRSDQVQKRRSMAINLAELVFHGAQAFQAVGALVTAAEKEAVEAHKAEDEAERAKLENALGMGAKGKGAGKALGGVASSIKALEEEQKKRGTRRKRDTAMSPAEIESTIVELEEEMLAAADELRFEYAAKLRDEIKELKRELRELSQLR